jgi:hypothetical protein
LMSIWYKQYIYFRRYGLQDFYTILINSILLFVVLFYIYPLKFLFTFLVSPLFGTPNEAVLTDGTLGAMVLPGQLPQLMLVFDAGYIAIFLVFILLFFHAYRRRDELGLNQIEIFDTKSSILNSAVSVGVGIVSVLITLVDRAKYAAWAGIIYPILLMPGFTILGAMSGRRRRLLQKRLRNESAVS